MRIERIYDRKDLIDITTSTVLHNMVVGIGLIFFLQWVFLGNLRSAVIVGMTIPFALFFAVGILVIRGEFGQSAFGRRDRFRPDRRCNGHHGRKHLPLAERPRQSRRRKKRSGRCRPAGLHGKRLAIFHAAADVNRSIFFAAGIIIAGFIPLFTLSGVEGHIFGPMAQTYAYALAGGLIATFTVTPALSALILPEHVEETETFVVRVAASHLYAGAGLLDSPQGRDHRRRDRAAGGRRLRGAACSGLEFLPKLEEGNLWIRATLPSTISLEEGNGYVNRMRRIVSSFPEVESVVSQHGRPDDGTDAAGFFNAELFVPLKPHERMASQARQGRPDR